MRKRSIVCYTLIFVLVINSYSHSFVYLITNPLVRSLISKNSTNVAKNYLIPIATGTGLAYLSYNSVKLVYDYINSASLPSDTNTDIVEEIEHDGYKYIFDRREGWSACYWDWLVQPIQVYSSYIVIRRNFRKGNCPDKQVTWDYNDFYIRASENPLIPANISISSTTIKNTVDDDDVILPISIDLSKSLSDNVKTIEEALKNNQAYSDVASEVTPSNVSDILAHLPPALVNQMPNSLIETQLINQKVIDQARELDNTTSPALTVTLEDVQAPTVPDVSVPEVPFFDTNLDIPEQVDFLEPVKNFIDNILNSVPFIAMFRDTNIEISDTQSVITFTYKDEIFEYDLNNHNSLFAFMSTVIIFVASVFAILILVV